MLNIDSIQNGIVIDHIQAGKGMRIYELLELDKLDCCVAIIKNARSSKLGRKDIIKIEGELSINFDVLGFIDNHITVCTIRDGALVKKENIVLPKRLKNVIRCRNPRCITSSEEGVDQIFTLCDEKTHRYRCIYCETALNLLVSLALRASDRKQALQAIRNEEKLTLLYTGEKTTETE